MPDLNTSKFQQLISGASANNQPVDLGKNNTHTVSPTSPIDLSGIPAIVGDNVTIDVSGAHDYSSGAVFKDVGSRTELAQDIINDAGDVEITVGTGHSITPGDPIIIASDEAHPSGANANNNRDYYKGERVYVEQYFDADGTGGADTIRVSPHLHFTYNGANNRVYLLNENELTIGKGITIKGAVGGKQRGLLLDTVNADINCEFQNVTERCIAAVRSSVRFGGVIHSASDGTSPTTRYGVHCAGFTDLRLDSAEVWAGRHAVLQASGGFSTLDLADGSSTGTSAGYSSRLTVSGGTYGNLSQQDSHKLSAVDTHGTTLQCSISGANIYGGVSVAADQYTISGSYIEAHNFRGAYVTADVAAADYDWCSLSFTDNVVRIVGNSNNLPDAPFVETKRDPNADGTQGMRSLEIRDNLFIGDFFTSSTQPFILRLPVRDGKKVSGNTFKVSYTGESFPGQTQMIIEAWNDVDFTDNDLDGTEIEIQTWDTGITIDITGTEALDSFRRGVRVDGVHTDPSDGSDVAKQIEKVIGENLRIEGCFRQGLSVRNAGDVYVSGVLRDNGTDMNGTDDQRSNLNVQDTEQLVARDGDFQSSNADTNQAIHVQHTGNTWSPSNTDLRFANIDVRTSAGGTEIDTSTATVTIVTQRDVRTTVSGGRRDRIEHLTMPNAGSDPANTGEVQRNSNDYVFEGGLRSIGDHSRVRVEDTSDAALELVADTDANEGGTQEWSVTAVASDGDLAFRDETGSTTYAILTTSGNLGLGGYTTPSYDAELAGAMRLRDSSTDPSVAGEFRNNGGDVKVYSGGVVRNFSDVGSLPEIQDDAATIVSSADILDFGGGHFTVTNPSGDQAQIELDNDTVTVAGNAVSLGGSTAVDHANLSNIGSSDHHTKPTTGDGLTGTNTFAVDSTVARTNVAETFTSDVDVQGLLEVDDSGDAILRLTGGTESWDLKLDNSENEFKFEDGATLVRTVEPDGSFIGDGVVQVGGSGGVTDTAGMIRWTGSNLEYYDGTSWQTIATV